MNNHSFDIQIATEYKSVEVAIMVWHFQYWINQNKRQQINLHDGKTWTYQKLTQIAACFPYWSKKQVERLVNKLVDLKILMKGNYHKDWSNRTVWYAFVDEQKFLLPDSAYIEPFEAESSISRNREIDIPKSGNGKSRNREML